MRPRFSDIEIQFLLGILREAEATRKRQIENLVEEQQHVASRIYDLHHRLVYQGDFHAAHDLKSQRQKLTRIEMEWLPSYDKQTVVLRGMIVRLEKILAHRRGRIPCTTWLMSYYLNELYQKHP